MKGRQNTPTSEIRVQRDTFWSGTSVIYASVEQAKRETNHVRSHSDLYNSALNMYRAQGKTQLGKLPICAQERIYLKEGT